MPVAAGVASVIGHVYPVWLRFRGGKGVATAAGVFAVLAPMAAARRLWGVSARRVWITRYISVGSLAATAGARRLTHRGRQSDRVPIGALVSALVIVHRHRANLSRLFAGTERRVGQRARCRSLHRNAVATDVPLIELPA